MTRQRVQRLSDWEDAHYSIVPPRASRDRRMLWVHGQLLIELGRVNTQQRWCEFSQKALAEVLGVCRQTLNTATAELVEWGYVQKKSQQETGTSFCHYRVILDPPKQEGGVSPGDDTPPGGGVSPGDDTRVVVQATHVSPASTDTLLDQRSKINTPLAPQGGQTPVELFEQFYAAYPRRVGKTEAFHAFHLIAFGKKAPGDAKRRRAKTVARATPAELTAAAARFAAASRGKDAEYLPHPATWLNNARWLDDVPVATVSTVSTVGVFVRKAEDPEAFEAWLAYQRTQAEQRLPNRVHFMETHGFIHVAARMPPEETRLTP